MALVIVRVCDTHAASPPPEVERDPVRFDGVEWDMCGDCQNTATIAQLPILADEHGRAIEYHDDPGARSRRGPSCRFGCNDGRPFKSMQGLRQHHSRNHPGEEAP